MRCRTASFAVLSVALIALALLKVAAPYKSTYSVGLEVYYAMACAELLVGMLLWTSAARLALVVVVAGSLAAILWGLLWHGGVCGCLGPIGVSRGMHVALASAIGAGATVCGLLDMGCRDRIRAVAAEDSTGK